MYEKTPSSHHVARLYRPGSGRRYTPGRRGYAGSAAGLLARYPVRLLGRAHSLCPQPVPVAALALLFYFLLGNAWYGAGLTTLIWGLLSYINLVKVDARGDPFVPGDILLLTEGMEAVGSYQLNMHWGKLALLLVLSLALILLGTGVKSARPRLVIRLVAALTVVAAFGTTMAFLYPDSELYDRMEGPNRANVPAVYEAFGFPYCFLHNFNLYPVDKPPGYNAQEAASYEDTYREAEAAPETAPNILMVMCEAFTDLPNQAAFTYTGENTPSPPTTGLPSRRYPGTWSCPTPAQARPIRNSTF